VFGLFASKKELDIASRNWILSDEYRILQQERSPLGRHVARVKLIVLFPSSRCYLGYLQQKLKRQGGTLSSKQT